MKEEIKNLVAQGKTNKAIELALSLDIELEAKEEFMLYSNRYQRIMKDSRLKIANRESIQIELNELNHAILNSIEKYENLEIIKQSSLLIGSVRGSSNSSYSAIIMNNQNELLSRFEINELKKKYNGWRGRLDKDIFKEVGIAFTGEPKDKYSGYTVNFTLTNIHKRFDLKILNIYVETANWEPLEQIIKLIPLMGLKEIMKFYCTIDKEKKKYKAYFEKSGSYLILNPGELESVELNVLSQSSGKYSFNVLVEYVVGNETKIKNAGEFLMRFK